MNPDLIALLFEGSTLNRSQSAELFTAIMSGTVEPAVLGAVLAAMKVRGETIDEITGAADALRTASLPFPRPQYQLVDIVGTGGDGQNTLNISTLASVVAAAAGAKVAKHGGRRVSGKTGSSDLMMQFGVNTQMPPTLARKSLDKFGLCFLFAPHYNPGFSHAAATRKALNTRTIFNLIGPLLNPARPDAMLLGVYSADWVMPIAEALRALQVRNAMVVHGAGLDEIALHGPTHVAQITGHSIERHTLLPDDFGVPAAPLEAIAGGTPLENFRIASALLTGHGTDAQQHVVAINAGAALFLSGHSPTLRAGTAMALECLASGKAMQLLENVARSSHETVSSVEPAHV